MRTQEAFVDSVDQDQTAQNVQSDLWSTLSTLNRFLILQWKYIFSQWKTTIYSFGSERVNLLIELLCCHLQLWLYFAESLGQDRTVWIQDQTARSVQSDLVSTLSAKGQWVALRSWRVQTALPSLPAFRMELLYVKYSYSWAKIYNGHIIIHYDRISAPRKDTSNWLPIMLWTLFVI